MSKSNVQFSVSMKHMLFLQVFVIILLLLNLWVLARSLDQSTNFVDQTNSSLEKFKDKYLEADKVGDGEAQHRLVVGYVQRSQRINQDMSDAVQHLQNGSQGLCVGAIAINILSMGWLWSVIRKRNSEGDH
jgi:lipopolysaccharide export LptBFGC system permease protein LptF